MSLLFSAVAQVWIDLPWWKIFRRCVSISALITLVLFLRYGHGQPFRSLGLGSWRHGRRQFVKGALIAFATVTVMASVYLLTGVFHIALHPDTAKVWRTLLGFLPAACLVGVLEELIFRGYVFGQLMTCSKAAAFIGSSAAYALVHLRSEPVWPNTMLELTGLFILGWVLALSVWRTKSLYLAIGLHAVLAYFARVNKLLVQFPQPSPDWLVGTSRLVNGVLPWLVLCAIGWIVWRLSPPRQVA